MAKVTEMVEKLTEEFLEDKPMELVDVEFIKEGKHRYLRVYVDKEGGISLDDCKLISDYLNVKIDEKDPIKENYFLEVSSPGIERPLKKDRDYEKTIGKVVQAKLYSPIEGRKIVDGILKGYENDIVSIEIGEEEVMDIPKDKISLIKPVIQF